MLPLLAIPIVSQATSAAQSSSFFSQRIDVILYDLLMWFGWIPIAITLIWGFIIMWQNYRQGIFSSRLKYTVFAIDVPTATEQSPKALENLFASLFAAKSSITWKELWIDGKLHPVFSFEIVSTEGYIQFLIRAQTRFRDLIEAGIYAHYPEAQISEIEDYAWKYPNEFPNDEYEMWGAELTYDRPNMYPIRTYVDFEDRLSAEIKDPLAITLEQMATMRAGEHFWIQILIQPSTSDWQKEGVKYAKKVWGGEEKAKPSGVLAGIDSLLSWPAGVLAHATGIDLSSLLGGEKKKEDDPWKAFKITLPEKEEADIVLKKSAKIGFGTKIRIVYVAKKNAYVKVERAPMVKGTLNTYSHLNFNKLGLYIPQVPKDDYFWMRWVYTKKQHRLMLGYQKRSWGIGANPMFMNVEELATLWHFPAVYIKAPLVKKSESKRAEPPSGLPMTHLEDTLPNYVPPVSTQESSSAPYAIPTFESVEDEPLPEALPHPQAPVFYSRVKQEQSETASDSATPIKPVAETISNSNETDDGGFVPPNLPV